MACLDLEAVEKQTNWTDAIRMDHALESLVYVLGEGVKVNPPLFAAIPEEQVPAS